MASAVALTTMVEDSVLNAVPDTLDSLIATVRHSSDKVAFIYLKDFYW